MSYEELDRVGVIERVIEKRLTQAVKVTAQGKFAVAFPPQPGISEGDIDHGTVLNQHLPFVLSVADGTGNPYPLGNPLG